ncbi:MAG: gas vesicle protein [Candidatus Bathyarchaeota archaeon]|nr:gas vesicle protein [Candidatus Bathyarchaeota archaeon]
MSMQEIIRKVKDEIPKLVNLKLNSVVGIVKTEDGWKVTVEMVEKESIPSSMDLLGIYEVAVDREGNILGLERKGLRKRIDTEISKVLTTE